MVRLKEICEDAKRNNGALNEVRIKYSLFAVRQMQAYSWSTQPELWIGQYGPFLPYALNVRHGTLGMKMELRPRFRYGDGNPDYYRDKLTSENSTNKSAWMVVALDILPKN
ncbi:hypothetical protein NXX82_22610 [Bacteroides fragilis]|nr:hypothetical protein [Bacteroides fragilis]